MVRTPSRRSAAGRSDPPAAGLRAGRADLVARADLVGVGLRAALTALYDDWLAARLAGVAGVALVAVGGLGRREPAPYSDLDLLLLHRGQRDVDQIADAIWYPVWDAGVSLDHSVRTVAEAVAVARSDLKAGLGLLSLRHVAGDPALSGLLRESVFAAWRADAPRRLPQLRALARAREQLHGELAFLLEPDLKEASGGLRDVHALDALAAAQLVDPPGAAVTAAAGLLLDARGELHRRAGRALDRFVQQEQAEVGSALGWPDADDMLRAVSEAGRVIRFAGDAAWRRVDALLAARRGWRRPGRRPPAAVRRPLADGVVEQDGEVVLARDADPWADPALLLRAATAAARSGLPLAPHALDRLATESAPLSVPWPAAARDAFVDLLGAGPAAVPVIEALDQAGLLVRLLPEWERVRSLPQRNPVHRYTVDRHLVETAANAAGLTRTVSRPDLLLLGAFFHDIGKGGAGDHTAAGVEIARGLAPRIGLSYGDAATVVAMVRHHLLLPDTATRRDLEDPATIAAVVDAVAWSADLLELLHALSIADGLATGPAAWSDWKAKLVADLVHRAGASMSGSPVPPQPLLSDEQRALARSGRLAVRVDGDRVTVAAPDAPGLFSRLAGVLALHQLDVRSASATTVSADVESVDAAGDGEQAQQRGGAGGRGGTAGDRRGDRQDGAARVVVDVFTVAPRFGRGPDPALLREDIGRALAGTLPLAERLAATERDYAVTADAGPRPPVAGFPPPPRVLWFDGAATDATVLELRAADSVGLLYRVTAALERCGLDLRSARVSTLGGAAVDAFYLVGPDGGPVTGPELRDRVSAEVLAAVSG